MRNNKTCQDLIKDKYEYTINQINLINRIDDPELSFKDLMNIVEDMGYDVFDYVTREHNINNNIVELERDIDSLADLKYDIISEYPLSIEQIGGGIKILLSWGGPSDYFMIYDQESTYHYLDWYDGASMICEYEDHQLLKEIWGIW